MYKRADEILAVCESQGDCSDFVGKFSKNLNNDEFFNLAGFDNFLMQNSTFLNLGRGLAPVFPSHVATLIASYVSVYDRPSDLF